MKNISSTFMVTLILVSAFVWAFSTQAVRAAGTIYIRADGSIDPPTAPIMTADNVTYVFTDNITDQIVVERSNILIDGAGYTVQGEAQSGTGIFLSGRSNVTVTRARVEDFYLGIHLTGSSFNIIRENNLANNGYAVYLEYPSNSNTISRNTMTGNTHGVVVPYGGSSLNTISANNITDSPVGIYLYASSNTISGNNITNNNDGIVLHGSSDNAISGNSIKVNSNAGIYLNSYSNNNTISENSITNNSNVGIMLYTDSINNVISGNNVTNNAHGIYLYGSSDTTISGNNITDNSGYGIYLGGYGIYSSFNAISGNNIANNAHGISLDALSSNTTISGNNITDNYDGIHLQSTAGNVISENNITGNNHLGIDLDNSYSNTISENSITNNEYGIQLMDSPSNEVFHNNFINNPFQAYVFDSPFSVWDDGYPSGGNYWSDYTGVDVKSGPNQDQPGSDRIGDTSYIFDYGRDRYPFMNPLPPVHDVAVTGITLSKTGCLPKETVGEGRPIDINVTIENKGDFTESFTVRLWANETMIAELPVVDLTPDTTIVWELDDLIIGGAKGNIRIMANATVVAEETEIGDNTCIYGYIFQTIPGDVDGDRDVDIFDIVRMAGGYGTLPPNPEYNPNCDIDGDGDIDIFDLVIAAGHYGESW